MKQHAERSHKETAIEDTSVYEVPKMPPRVIVDLRTDCNLKCPMCIVHGDTDNPKLDGFLKRDVDLDQLLSMVDEVAPHSPMMMASLWSEPLLAKAFKPYVEKLNGLGLTLALNTNGLRIRKDFAEYLIEQNIDAIAVSVDAHTPETLLKVRGVDKLEKIQNAVHMLLDARGDKLAPRIGVSITVQDENKHEVEDFVEHWIEYVDFVRVGELYTVDGFSQINTDMERKPCLALYNTIAIHADGNVSYCCLDGFAETSVGNAYEDGVETVWNGDKMNQVRHWHETAQWDKVPFCKNCDRWASYDFEETVKDGVLIRKSPEYTYYNRIDRLENWSEELSGGLHDIPTEDVKE
ncbi:radical SAM/SPASM domain-containing protein [Magnetovibrio sp. PR-2]|uniref:radical SAM/SPASM domain-containing protein n=1 Tax=Magnetovibrio sp. PR-2 TaxID=3120356 RepID=UPI002FCE2520